MDRPTRAFFPSFLASLLSLVATSARGADNTAKQQYRNFANSRRGDAARGKSLFASEDRLACTRCHALDGKGAKVGPDLSTVGDRFSRRELIDAGLTHENRVLKSIRQTATAPEHVASFARDTAGNLYVVEYEGMIYKLDFTGVPFDDQPATGASALPGK